MAPSGGGRKFPEHVKLVHEVGEDDPLAADFEHVRRGLPMRGVLFTALSGLGFWSTVAVVVVATCS